MALYQSAEARQLEGVSQSGRTVYIIWERNPMNGQRLSVEFFEIIGRL